MSQNISDAGDWRTILSWDRVRRKSADESRQVELCQMMWALRHAVLLASLLNAFFSGANTSEIRIFAGYFALQLVSHATTRLFPARSAAIMLVDGALLATASWIGLPPAVVFLLVVAIWGWAATFRPVTAMASYVMSVAVILIAVRDGNGPPGIFVLAFCMVGLVFMIRTIRLNIGARIAADRERLVAERIDAVMWEEIPGTAGAFKVTSGAERLLGYAPSQWATPGFGESLLHPDDAEQGLCAFKQTTDRAVTIRMRRADGEWRWMESRVNQVTDKKGRPAFLVGVLIDRSEQVEAEREALAFGQLVATSPIGQMLLRCDEEGPVIFALNHTCLRILSHSNDAVGSRLSSHKGPAGELAALIARAPKTDPQFTVEFTGAEERVHQVTMRKIDARSCSVDFLDITERVESGRKLHAQARQDHLTRLPNRRAFVEALEARLALPDKPSTAVLLIDLDRFKDINDSLGHETGDQLLCSIGRRILSRSRPTDLVARLGGDEFALILPDLTAEVAERRAAELADVINQPVTVGDLRLRVRASIGVASFPHDACDSSDVIRCADVAMYHAKSRGLGVARYGNGTAGFGKEQLLLVADLEAALAGDQLLLHHQPLLDLDSGRVVGTEVLARWQHPVHGLIQPDVFIELAEVSGQMKALTRWVIQRALRDLRELNAIDPTLKVSVNLSVRNLYEPDFLEWISAQIAKAGIRPGQLTVEITETTIMDDQSAAIDLIRGLDALGVKTWIDDFGTGHSSLARLRSLPVHGIKIDRSFLTNSAHSATDRMILRGLINLVRSMGLVAVAEGVESQACLDLLVAEECTLAQGFYVGRPTSLEALMQSLVETPVELACA